MTTHTEETIASTRCSHVCSSPIRYPFVGTFIVTFDAYGRSLLRHGRHLLRGFPPGALPIRANYLLAGLERSASIATNSISCSFFVFASRASNSILALL